MKKRLVVLSLLLLAAVVVACHSSSEGGGGMARIRAAGVLRWGGDLQGGEPYVYEDPSRPGTLIGFEVDLAAAIARELGVRAEYQQNDWSNLVPSLERGSFDVIMNGLEVTPSRTGRLLFSRPYYAFAERLMARKGDARVTANLAALRGLRVGTLANSYAFDLLRAELEPVLYEGVEEPYIDLIEGRTDAVLMDDIIAARYGEPKPGLAVVGDIAEGYYAIGIRRTEPDVKQAIDGALERVAKSGELQRILERWSLWGDRERRLVDWTDRDQATMTGQAPPPASLTWGHAVLYHEGAGITLVISTLAMVLAVALGLGLALARMVGPTWLRPLAAAYVEIYRGTPVLPSSTSSITGSRRS
ncbi:MAG: transporter substrate-binding domain-containing protein [Polyangiaceae bacterium]